MQNESYQRTKMQKELILQKLKEQGCRITRQRLMLLDAGIGSATVYRMVNMLEEIGAISRKNMYKIDCSPQCRKENACTIEFDDDTTLELSGCKWNQVIQKGLIACGYMHGKEVRNIISNTCTEEKV